MFAGVNALANWARPCSPTSVCGVSAGSMHAFRDVCGETFGSVSSLQLRHWGKSRDTCTGRFFTLPDRL